MDWVSDNLNDQWTIETCFLPSKYDTWSRYSTVWDWYPESIDSKFGDNWKRTARDHSRFLQPSKMLLVEYRSFNSHVIFKGDPTEVDSHLSQGVIFPPCVNPFPCQRSPIWGCEVVVIPHSRFSVELTLSEIRWYDISDTVSRYI